MAHDVPPCRISTLARFVCCFLWNLRRGSIAGAHERVGSVATQREHGLCDKDLPMPQVVSQSEAYTWPVHVHVYMCIARASCQIELNL